QPSEGGESMALAWRVDHGRPGAVATAAARHYRRRLAAACTAGPVPPPHINRAAHARRLRGFYDGAVSGFLAAVVSMLYVVQTGNLTYNLGTPLVLAAFVATVVGGMGSLLGAV